jgi:hypothetical protein
MAIIAILYFTATLDCCQSFILHGTLMQDAKSERLQYNQVRFLGHMCLEVTFDGHIEKPHLRHELMCFGCGGQMRSSERQVPDK